MITMMRILASRTLQTLAHKRLEFVGAGIQNMKTWIPILTVSTRLCARDCNVREARPSY